MEHESSDADGLEQLGHYQTLATLAISSQDNRWTSFSAYLLANSFLIVAWATLFTATSDPGIPLRWALTAVSLIGAVS